MKRRAHARKVDANQQEIVNTLRAIPGVAVVVIEKPLDLMVGYSGVNFMFEIKNPDGRNRLTPDQEEFLEHWPGHAEVVTSALEIINRITGRVA